MKKSIGYAVLCAAVASVLAMSQQSWAQDPHIAVKKRDSNGDGKVSQSEWDGNKKAFAKFDADKDGFITLEEFARKWGVTLDTPNVEAKSIPTKTSPPTMDKDGGVIIADVHMHPHPDNEPQDVLSWMDRNNVQWAGLGAVKGGRDVREHYAQVMGNRYIAFGGQSQLNDIYRSGGNEALNDPNVPEFKALMEMLREDFAAGKLKGVGEIFANSRTTSKGWMGRKMKIDAPTNRAMMDLAAEYGGVLTIHVEWDKDSVEELQALAAHNADGRIIIAHCGSNTTPDDIRTILKQHQNLYCDLSARHPPKLHSKLMKKKPVQKIFTSTGLEEKWRVLIEEMPDRFMVGTDTKSERDYDGGIQTIRKGLLANLKSETAEKVAYKNAQQLLKLE